MAELSETSKSERSAGNHRHKLRVSILAVLVLCSLFFLFREKTSDQKIIWLNSPELVHSSPPGPWTQIKWKLETLPVIRTVVNRYHNSQPKLRVDSSFWQFVATPPMESALGIAFATNADATRAWILPSEKLHAFRQELDHHNPQIVPVAAPSIFTASGVLAEVQQGDSVSVGSSTGFAGFTLIVSPKMALPAIQMSVGASSTELVPESSATNSATLQTNLSIACNILLTNGDSLVIESSNIKTNSAPRYWLIMTPAAIDSSGKPILPAP